MNRLHERDLTRATYRSRDPIKNLKLKVTLKRVSASAVGIESGTSEESPQTLTTNQFGQTILEEEELTLHWQQKFFSQREVLHYGFEPNCTTVADYKYHAEVEKLKASGRKNNRIFTYVNNDRFSETETEITPVTTSKNEQPSVLSTKVSAVRRRRNIDQQQGISAWELQKGQKASAGLKLVENEPTDEFKENHHLLNTPVQTFTIMVDLSPEGQLGSAEFERVLCKIEYDDNCVLRVNPDFNQSPCRLQEGTLSRDVWEYTVAHASSPVSKLELQREAKMVSELYRKHQTYLKSLVGDDFEEMPAQLFRLLVVGEIVSAVSFEYDDLHVEYFIDLPNSWSCDPAQYLSGCTQSCKTRLIDNKEFAYFAHPFQYQTFMDLNEVDETYEWPKIFIHVISSDTWGRRRTEGYGYFTLPTTPGMHEVSVQCWRPTGNAGYPSVYAQLKRYFIGGDPELEDVMYTAIPSTFEGKHLSKYGLRCESTGSVRVRVNCIQQCQGFCSETSTSVSKKKWQTALKLARGKTSELAIHGILDSYRRARKRMLLARENVPPQTRVAAEQAAKEKLKNTSADEKIKAILTKLQKKDD